MTDWFSELTSLVTAAAALLGDALADSFLAMATPLYIAAVLVIMALERWIPARPNPPLLSAAYAQDILWALVQGASQLFVIVTWVALLKSLYDQHLSFLSVDLLQGLPAWAAIIVTLLILDFLQWLQHLVQHKMPWFWEFHAVHHSQPHLNLFTDYRIHVFEYVVRKSVFVLPMLMLGLEYISIVWISLFLAWHARLYHANIRSDFGPLRWALVTPQSHRIHHSIEPRHRDRNFGGFLCIWDRLFGTHVDEWSEYPATGISDRAFPLETSARPDRVLWTLVRQTVYPVISIWRSLGRGSKAARSST